jgi:hypothetical protein
MWPFKKKIEPEFVIKKEVPYNGHTIFLWVQEAEAYKGLAASFGIWFDMGWSTTSGGGYYHTSVAAASVEKMMIQFVEAGKEDIDAFIQRPSQIEAAKKRLENLELT